MKNYQIISYNCDPQKYYRYNFENVLYVFYGPERRMECKYYMFINDPNIEKEMISYLGQYYKRLCDVLFLDNTRPVKINADKLEDCILASGKIKSATFDKILTAKTFHLHGLTLNCKSLSDNSIGDMSSRRINGVYFPEFSYFMHKNYRYCNFNINPGIIQNPF